jgi:4-amino-4-deoxy-L-arabinose transferase-like glycosyltransferase
MAFEPMDTRAERFEWPLLALLAGACAVFLWVGIERPIWLDEAFCALAAARPPAAIVEMLRTDNSMPFYYFLLSAWVLVFGDSEIALRLMSGLFYVAGGVVTGLLGRRLGHGNARAGLYAALFYLCSLQAIHQAQNVRMYSLLGLLAGASLLMFLRLFFDDEPRRWWAAYFLLNTIGVMTQHWFVFVLFAQFVALAVWRRERLVKFVVLAVAAGGPFLLAWSPILMDQMRNGSSKWIPTFRAWFVSDAFTRFYGGYPALFLYGFAAVVLGKAEAEKRRSLVGRRSVQVAVLAFALCVCVPLVVTLVKPLYWPDRYTIIALPALAALLGLIFAEAAPRPVAIAVGVALLSFQVWFQFASREHVTFGDYDPRTAELATARYVATNAAPGDAVVFTSLSRAVADYYLGRLGAAGRYREFSYPAEFAWHLGWENDRELVKNPERLVEEADALTQTLAGMGTGRRVWLYYCSESPLGPVLRQRLERVLPLERTQEARGPFHQALLVYRVP